MDWRLWIEKHEWYVSYSIGMDMLVVVVFFLLLFLLVFCCF